MDSKYLSLGKFKVNYIENKFREAVLTYIEDIPGSKTIVWDDGLHGQMALLRIKRRIKELGIEEKVLVEGNVPHIRTQHVIFIIRPSSTQTDLVADMVHGLSKSEHGRPCNKDFHILLIPRELKMCTHRLQQRGVLGSVDVKSINVQLFPFEGDVLSMEVDHVFKELVVDKDPSKITDVALALHELNMEYGPFPHIISRGSAAVKVIDDFLELQALHKPRKTSMAPIIQHVIILDRQLDLISPLLTQLTYEGLIDELFGLNCNIASFPGKPFYQDEDVETESYKKVVSLSSADDLYSDLRDRNFNGVGPVLRQKARTVQQELEKRHDKTMENMKKFVNQLPMLQAAKKSLALHTTIAELIKEKTDQAQFLDSLQTQQEILCNMDTDKVLSSIEDAIAKKVPILQVLRNMCLQSIINGGLKQRVLDYYKKEIIQTYGIEYLIPLANLERAGFLHHIGGPRNYPALKRTLRLINDVDSEVEPTDISFVHSIYAPLSVRLIENFRNWENMTDILDMVGGPAHEVGSAPPPKQNERQVVLVFFIGGCTYAEISALRSLAVKSDSNVEYVIVTTKIINGNNFLQSVMNG